MHKTKELEGFLGRPPESLIKIGLPLTRNALKPLAKIILMPLGLPVAASATNAAIHKKIFGSGFTTWTTSNQEMNEIMKII